MRLRRKQVLKEMQIPSPYGIAYHRNFQIAPASKVVFDNGERAYDAWLSRRQLEQDSREQKSYMIGALDGLESSLINLFQQIMEIQNTVESYMDYPTLTRVQKQAIKDISKDLGEISTVLSSRLLENLDKLGTVDQQKFGKQTK